MSNKIKWYLQIYMKQNIKIYIITTEKTLNIKINFINKGK